MKRHSGGLLPVIAAILFFGATPAMAATRTIEWITPTVADPILRQDGKIAVMTYNDDGRSTDKIEISIENPPASEDPCRPNPVTAGVRPPDGSRGAVPFETSIAFPCNGSYSVVASAWNTRQGLDSADKWSSVVLPIKVAIAPMPVQQLSSDGWIKGDDSWPAYIDLRWNPNNEVDLIGYRIDRSINNQSLETLVEIPAGEPTKYRDSGLEVASGTYTYKVVAIRKGASESERVESVPVSISVEAGAESSTPISGTPETPPTTTPPAPTQPPAPSLEKSYTPSSSSSESSGIKTEDNSKGTGGLSKTVQLPSQSSDQSEPANSTPTTIDTGYEDRLPFATGDGSGGTQGSGEALLEELGAGESTAKRRAIMVPIAGSLILVVGWMFARLIHREVSKADLFDGSSVVVSTAPWSISPNSDDTGPILTRSELQAVKRNKQRVSSSKRQI